MAKYRYVIDYGKNPNATPSTAPVKNGNPMNTNNLAPMLSDATLEVGDEIRFIASDPGDRVEIIFKDKSPFAMSEIKDSHYHRVETVPPAGQQFMFDCYVIDKKTGEKTPGTGSGVPNPAGKG